MILEDNLSFTSSRPVSTVRPGRATETNSDLWGVIWTAGALCWFCVAIIGILWAWPVSGTTQGGEHVVNSGARLLHHALLFLLSAPGYRIGVGQGWPSTGLRRAWVILVNAALALVVIRLAPVVLLVSSVLLDEPWPRFAEGIRSWEPMQANTAQWMSLLRFWLPPYVLGLIAVALVDTSRRLHRDSVKLAQLSAQLANARMATLSAQLHPHFLFNSLNAISGLIADRPGQAVEMVARLGDFLRIALESTKRPWTLVEKEVLGVQAYLEVQRSRFRDRLRVKLTIDPAALTTPIPALLLQPLVENAIEHGLSEPVEHLDVTVSVDRRQDRLRVIVTNSAPRLHEILSPASFGNGLRNVSARLRAAYDGAGTLTIGPDHVCGTRAELNTPAMIENTKDVAESAN